MLDKSGNQKAKGALEKDDEISKQVFNGVLDSQCKFSFDLRWHKIGCLEFEKDEKPNAKSS